MKSKTIKAIIAKKISEWLGSIDDESARKIAEESTIVTGGCIASMLLGEEVHDFDLYFRTHDAALRLAEYYVKRFEVKDARGIPCPIKILDKEGRIKIVIKSAGIASEDGTLKAYEYFEQPGAREAADYIGDVMDRDEEIDEAIQKQEDEKPRYRPVFMSTNAITLANKIQIILRFYGEPDQLHENYDFAHCTNYWTSWDGELVLRPKALEALLARELVYIGSKYPVCSIFRLRKFIKRGFTINAGQIVKMCMQISELELSNLDVLEDQLTGVDCAYFIQVLAKLKDKDPEKINATYLVEIIDRMF